MQEISYNFAVDLLILCLQLLSTLGNGFILLLFLRSRRLRRNSSLRLVLVLAMADLLFALSSMPLASEYLLGWSPQLLNYDGRLIIWLAAPQVVQVKLNLCITTAIALDRLQAMRWPLHYRNKSHGRFAAFSVAVGLGLGLVDVLLSNVMDPLWHVPGCASIGCFVSRQFRFYWGCSNVSLNALMLALTVWVYVEFNRLRQQRSAATAPSQAQNRAKEREQRNFQQTNRLSVGVLGISLLFLLLPSTLVGLSDLAGVEMFALLGPFYIVGLLLAGVSNSFAYIWLHVELRAAAKAVLLRQELSESSDQAHLRTRIRTITISKRVHPPHPFAVENGAATTGESKTEVPITSIT